MKSISFRWSEELVARVDAARGDVPRSRWVRRTVEQALGGGGTGATARSAAGSADERPAPAEQSRRAGPDVMAFRRVTQR